MEEHSARLTIPPRVSLKQYAKDMGVSYGTARKWYVSGKITGFQISKASNIFVDKTVDNGYRLVGDANGR